MSHELTSERARAAGGFDRRMVLGYGGRLGLALAVSGGSAYLGVHENLVQDFINQLAGVSEPYRQLEWVQLDVSPEKSGLQFKTVGRDTRTVGPCPADVAKGQGECRPLVGGNVNNWTKLGILATDAATLAEQRRRLGGVQAVVFAAGDTVNVGYDSQQHDFLLPPRGEPNLAATGLRVGPQHDLHAAVANFNLWNGELRPAPQGTIVLDANASAGTVGAQYGITYS